MVQSAKNTGCTSAHTVPGNAGDAGADDAARRSDPAARSVVLRAGICVSDEGIGLRKANIGRITRGNNDYQKHIL